ncbi:hypothetical protein [Phenylobacterium sp.]|uniref:hypothetical protein n=1 Tax=Phenylobacterium sp. TaxID=1871053 RepID=UPI00273219E7|nr:hypothetical protein [Phenylobacterium sp.]MDP1599003.1 hypothetical protein [Phenylobacterium sp.]MDP3590431.1 hypothetical protein [Phenylobacterium sp.]
MKKPSFKQVELALLGLGSAASLVGAIVAWGQAATATKAAHSVQITSAELTRMAEAAERQFAAANRAAGAAEALAAATERGTAELAAQTTEASSQRRALDRSSAAASDLVGAVRSESTANATRYAESRSAALSTTAFRANNKPQQGTKPSITLTVENAGRATNYWIVSNFDVLPQSFNLSLQICDSFEKQRFAISNQETVTSSRTNALTATDNDLIQAETHVLVYSGSICWENPNKQVKKWFFCQIVDKNGNVRACDKGNGPD